MTIASESLQRSRRFGLGHEWFRRLCSLDNREDNSLTLGIEPADLDRQGLEIEYIVRGLVALPHTWDKVAS